MNKYDTQFIFRIANIGDVDGIMRFIKEEWAENHILASDKEFFIWMYGNDHYGDKTLINFFLMIDRNSNEIVGINGFIPYSDENDRLAVSSAMTKVKNNISIPMAGVELIKRFKSHIGAKKYYSYGTNPKTMIPIGEKIFRYSVGKMQQYYILNDEMEEFCIANIKHRVSKTYQKTCYNIKRLYKIQDIQSGFNFDMLFYNQGYKSEKYIKKRYFEHPIYKYDFYGICKHEEKEYVAIVIGREIVIDTHKIFRIVDYLGDVKYLGEIGESIRLLIKENVYEYVDLLVSSFPNEMIERAGFVHREEKDENIIPNYFEPFLRENINLWYQKSDENVIIFKADGDQDRPNH